MPISDLDTAWLTLRQSDEASLALVTFVHSQMETYRFVRNKVDIISRGQTFKKAPFLFDTLNDDAERTRSTIQFPNVDRIIGIALQNIVGAPEVILEMVSSARLDNPFYRAARLKLRNVTFDDIYVSGDLVRGDDGTELCGNIKCTPARCPAMFKRI